MEDTIEITLEVNKKEWENLKTHSGLTRDYFLLMFFYQVGERILEAIVRAYPLSFFQSHFAIC